MGSTIGIGDNVKLWCGIVSLNKKWQSAVFSRVLPALLRMRDNINNAMLASKQGLCFMPYRVWQKVWQAYGNDNMLSCGMVLASEFSF